MTLLRTVLPSNANHYRRLARGYGNEGSNTAAKAQNHIDFELALLVTLVPEER
jgi:hypothetical protein